MLPLYMLHSDNDYMGETNEKHKNIDQDIKKTTKTMYGEA